MQKTYYGNPISQHGLEEGYVDYACLASAFNHVLCNNIQEVDPYIWDNVECGDCYRHIDEETGDELSADECAELDDKARERIYDEPREIYQWYIVANSAVDILNDADEIVFYSDVLDCYVWGVTHYGTAWDYVLTNIKIKKDEE